MQHVKLDRDTSFKFWAILLLLAVTGAYANHFLNGFHFDDYHTIVNNSFIRSIRNIPRFFTDATTFSSLPSNQSYRPLVSATLALDYLPGNGNVFFFHLSTFLLFLVQGGIMFFLYIRIFDLTEDSQGNRFIALCAVAWYLLHPANAETINYIIARSDSLSTLFILMALVCFISWDTGRKWHLYLIFFAVSCLAKPMGAVFVFLLPLYLLLFEETKKPLLAGIWDALKKSAPSFLACVAMMVFIKRMDPPTWQAGGSSEFHYIITQPWVLVHYFTTFFAPVSLSADTDWGTLPSMYDARFIFGIVFLAGLLLAAALTARKKSLKPIAFGILWFLITLLPTSMIPLAEVMNDHRIFLPYVGLTISVCWSIHLLLEKASTLFSSRALFYRATTALIVTALAAYAFGTHVRNNVWHSDESLWKDVTIKSPKNGRGLMNYGLALMRRGDYAGAETYFTKALQFTPYYANLYVNLGVVKAATGRSGEAEPYFQKAIALNPAWPDGYYFYADFLDKQKRYDGAILNAQRALSLASAHLNARKLLMKIFLELGQFDTLRTLAEQTLLIAPGDKQVEGYLTAAEKGGPQVK
jgi:tetratricopeptide (TPR) repeat protein